MVVCSHHNSPAVFGSSSQADDGERTSKVVSVAQEDRENCRQDDNGVRYTSNRVDKIANMNVLLSTVCFPAICYLFAL